MIVSADPLRAGLDLGVVIPALDEAEHLPRLLDDLSRLKLEHVVLVVDGGSRDGTVAAARAGGAEVMRSRLGRARQMNAGARLLASRWLLFLHADSRLGEGALPAIEGHVGGGRREAGYFRLLISHPHFHYRIIEGGQRVRQRVLGLVYGDQGLLIRRDLFFEVGPYPDEPIMEDVILNRRLRRARRLVRLGAAISTSARRYEDEGRLRGWLRNVRLISRFLAGAKPVDLAARYPVRRSSCPWTNPREHRERPGSGLARRFEGGIATLCARKATQSAATQRGCIAARMPGGFCPRAPRGKGAECSVSSSGRAYRAILLVFAKAPRPGEVKTRLARSLGGGGSPNHEAAAALYRQMGRLVVDNVAEAPATVTVCYDPPGAEAEIRDWLGPAPQRYWQQGEGDLGDRMSRMFDRAFEAAGRVVVIGTDTPAVDAGTVVRALAALDTADVVLGPSRDGGYYLMALREPRPGLFAAVSWSTGSVLAETVGRAGRLGLGVTFLEVESDVDTAADLTAEVKEQLNTEC